MIYKRQMPDQEYLTREQMNIIINSQRLWLQLVFGIRNLLFSVLRDKERTQSSANQLFGFVSGSFYNYLRFFYGPEKAQQFVNSLTGFITSIWRIFDDIAANHHSQDSDPNTIALYKSADQMASLLAGTSVYWSEEQWKDYLYQLAQTMIQEALAVATKDFNAEYQIFRRIVDLSILMGDYMARGIIAGSGVPTQAPPAGRLYL